MRSCFVLFFASLLTSCEAQGTIETPVFVLKGRDLLLELHADPPEGVLSVDWKINKTVDLVRFDPSGKATVTGRFEFPENKFSVILKNLQEVDSGVYSAVAKTLTGDKLVAEYKVTVQGPVSPVELTVDRVDSSSSESCDLHVTCRTHNSHISSTLRCVDRVCSQEGGERSEVTTSGASLQLYLLNSTIICNHSNQAHSTQDLIHAEHLCPSIPGLHYAWIIAICFAAVYCGFWTLFLFIWCYRQRRIICVGSCIERIQKAIQELTSALLLNESPADTNPDVGRGSESPVHAHLLPIASQIVVVVCDADTKVIVERSLTKSEIPHENHDENVTNSSDKHETQQSNPQDKTSASPGMSCPADYAAGLSTYILMDLHTGSLQPAGRHLPVAPTGCRDPV